MGRHLEVSTRGGSTAMSRDSSDYLAARLLAEIAEIEQTLATLRASNEPLAGINLWCLEELLRSHRDRLGAIGSDEPGDARAARATTLAAVR